MLTKNKDSANTLFSEIRVQRFLSGEREPRVVHQPHEGRDRDLEEDGRGEEIRAELLLKWGAAVIDSYPPTHPLTYFPIVKETHCKTIR